jgi:hypothetical protein
MARPHSYILPSINTHPGFSGRNANQKSHGIFPSTKIIKLGAIEGNEKSPGKVLTRSPIVQKRQLTAKHTKNNFKKWFTIRTRTILVNMVTVSAARNVRNTAM